MDEVKWYENCTLDSIKNIIKNNINITSRSFVAIGYYLKNVRDRKLYLQDGYKNILEFAEGEFNISESWANKWMRINDRFSKDGNSPILLDEYKGFRSSILAEMITLTDEQLEQVTLTTTRAEIRNIKKQAKKEKDLLAPAPVEVVSEDLELKTVLTSEQELEITTVTPINKSPDKNIPTFELNGEAYGATRSEIIVSFVKNMVEMDMGIEEINGICCHVFGFNYYAYNIENDGYITIEDEDERPVFRTSIRRFQREYNWHKPKLETLLPEGSVNDKSEISGKECSNCTYNDMTLEEFKSIDPAGGLPCNDCDDKLNNWMPKIETVTREYDKDFPCDTCGYDINGCCDYDNEDMHCVCGDMWKPKKSEDADHVETVEADIIQTPSADQDDDDDVAEIIDPEKYTCQDIRDELNKLIEYVGMYRKNNDTAPGRRKAKMRLDAMVLLDEEMRKPPAIEEPEPVQPELPVLKNNDQRKEWIDTYTSWPVWIDIPQTGERYYRYDFSNDTSFVIRVSLQHAYKGYERTKDIKYAHEEYFLLGVKNKWIPGMPTFVESSTNKSSMVEHLKEIQKKGAS